MHDKLQRQDGLANLAESIAGVPENNEGFWILLSTARPARRHERHISRGAVQQGSLKI